MDGRSLLEASCALVFALSALACQPDIGDPCTIPSDCSLSGDRFCDTTQPGGYCTQFNCEPGDCPEEAICIGFFGSESAAPECRDPQDTPRLQRTFCMRKCEHNSDCRTGSGYACVDVEEVDAWSASIVEKKERSKVCIQPFEGGELSPDQDTDVCSPPPLEAGSFPPPLDAPTGPPSDSGADARSDAAVTLPDAGSDGRADGGGRDAEADGSLEDASRGDAVAPRDAARDAPFAD